MEEIFLDNVFLLGFDSIVNMWYPSIFHEGYKRAVDDCIKSHVEVRNDYEYDF